MTEVEFHTGVDDPMHFACRLLRKAYRQGVKVLVTAPAQRLAELDRALWTFEALEFLPHVRAGGSAALAARTPIWLSEQADLTERPSVLVNLGAPVPSNLDGLIRLIEILSTQADDVAEGRERWRVYQSLGLPTVHHPAGAQTH